MTLKNTNSLAARNSKPKFSVAIQSEGYQKLINNTLRDKEKSNRFIASISSAVSSNLALQECDAGTILSAGLLGEALSLSPSPQLGHYYMVPFNDKKNDRKVATFQLGYKGYIQLAIRSGQYKKLNVIAIKKGELISYNPLDEELDIKLIEDEEQREKAPTIGYYAMFELVNGFRKTIYWSKAKMEAHATKYSMGYAAKKGYTFWEKDFDGMAYKTMLRQLISKWGIMSIEMTQAFTNDYGFKESDSDVVNYVEEVEIEPINTNEMDTKGEVIEPEVIEPSEAKKPSKSLL